jgi:phenylacetate-CoA ligase
LILRQAELAPHYVLEVTRTGYLDALCVKVEVKAGSDLSADQRDTVARALVHHVKSYIGVSVDVVLMSPNEIERSVGKARRVIDKRNQQG